MYNFTVTFAANGKETTAELLKHLKEKRNNLNKMGFGGSTVGGGFITNSARDRLDQPKQTYGGHVTVGFAHSPNDPLDVVEKILGEHPDAHVEFGS